MKAYLRMIVLLAMAAPFPLAVSAEQAEAVSPGAAAGESTGTAEGFVFEDANGNLRFDEDAESGIKGVAVSDGGRIVLTDERGAWRLALTTESQVLFITQPANYQKSREFYRNLDPGHVANGETIRIDFPLRRAGKPDTPNPRFIQTSDIHIHGPADRERFARAIEEINSLEPAADFVAATGDLVETGNDLQQFEVYTSTTALSRIPWFHVFGNHDKNQGADATANYRSFLGPDYYSADYGDLHLLMLNSVHPSERQDRWLDEDIRLLGRGKKIFAFQHYATDEKTLAKLQRYGVRAVFTGHWHSNKVTSHGGGLVSINHPTFIMGGIDGSPSSFRIVSVTRDGFSSEFRFNEFGKRMHIVYPQEQLTGPERLLAQIYDTSGGVREARFGIGTEEIAALAEGALKQVSPLSWAASLAGRDLGLESTLPEKFQLRVRATNHRGEQWETSATISRASRAGEAPVVKLGSDWPQFMGSAQRTGVVARELTGPLSLRWMTSTGGAIDFSSPVLSKGRLAIGVKDRDNMARNGVAVLDAETGEARHFLKTDAMVNHSPAFAEGDQGSRSLLYAAAAGGTVYGFDADSGETVYTRQLGEEQQRWIYSAPAVQGNMAVLGSSPMLLSLDTVSNGQRWLSTFGRDWISSYSSPSFSGDLVIMGAYSLNHEKKPASIYALDAKSGELRWTNRCAGVHSSVAVAGGRGYATDSGGVFKVIDLATGKDIARRALDKKRAMSTPAVDDQIVVVPTGAGKVYGFDPRDFSQKWTLQAGPGLWNMSPYDKDKLAVFSSPTIAGSTVYIGCSDGKLYALDKLSGAVRWSYDFGVPTLSTPCISGNTLFTAAYDGNVYAFTSRAAEAEAGP